MLQDEIVERRSKPRVEGRFPARVRGTTAQGDPFEVHTLLDNLSISGLHMRLGYQVAIASPLFADIRLPGIEVKAKGMVKRIELERDGSFGLGVAFDNYRVCSASPDVSEPDSQSMKY